MRKELLKRALPALTFFLVFTIGSGLCLFFWYTTEEGQNTDLAPKVVQQQAQDPVQTETAPTTPEPLVPPKPALKVKEYVYRESKGTLEEVEPTIQLPHAPLSPYKGSTRPVSRTEPLPWTVSVSEADLLSAAKKNALHSLLEPKHFLGVAAKESDGGNNTGEPGREFKMRTAKGYATLKHLSETFGVDPSEVPLGESGDTGIMQALLSMIAANTGLSIDFGNTPKILLHGTAEAANMTRAERVSGISALQAALRIPVTGRLDAATLAKVREVTGERVTSEQGFLKNREVKFKLIRKFFDDEVDVTRNPSQDKVFQRICLVEGKNWRKTKYFPFNPWNPVHAFAYMAVHMEADMRLAGKGAAFGIAAYHGGYSQAKAGNQRAIRYRDDVLSIIAERYEGIA